MKEGRPELEGARRVLRRRKRAIRSSREARAQPDTKSFAEYRSINYRPYAMAKNWLFLVLAPIVLVGIPSIMHLHSRFKEGNFNWVESVLFIGGWTLAWAVVFGIIFIVALVSIQNDSWDHEERVRRQDELNETRHWP